jgi:hypothetical protein
MKRVVVVVVVIISYESAAHYVSEFRILRRAPFQPT